MGRAVLARGIWKSVEIEDDLNARTISQDISSLTGKPKDVARAALNFTGGDQQEACALLMSGMSLTVLGLNLELAPLELGGTPWLDCDGVVSSVGDLQNCLLLRFPRFCKEVARLLTLETLEVFLLRSLAPLAGWAAVDLEVPELRAMGGPIGTLQHKVFKPGLASIPLEEVELCALRVIKTTTFLAPGKSACSSPPSVLALDAPPVSASAPVRAAEEQGKQESSSYVKLREIGSGAFGSVHLASAPKGQLVAVKTVPVDGQERREVELLRHAAHPRIVWCRIASIHSPLESFEHHHSKCIDCFTSGKDLCIVMEFLPENLHQRIGGKALAAGQVRSFTTQLLIALAHLDSLQICHRDLKPENLLLEGEQLKLCDFGSAKRLSSDKPSASYICSRWWRAPELILGSGNYTTSIDWWSCGCIIAEMVCGRPIFMGESSWGQMYAIVRVLGTPSEAEMQFLTPHAEPGGRLAQHLSTLAKLHRASRLPELLSGSGGFLRIAQRLLRYAPQDRWHPTRLLKSRFLQHPQPSCVAPGIGTKVSKRLRSEDLLMQSAKRRQVACEARIVDLRS
ncbi:unnamed protein product [Effrenium voratum]|nr:unnamed protein product [Effrenium voratum]